MLRTGSQSFRPEYEMTFDLLSRSRKKTSVLFQRSRALAVLFLLPLTLHAQSPANLTVVPEMANSGGGWFTERPALNAQPSSNPQSPVKQAESQTDNANSNPVSSSASDRQSSSSSANSSGNQSLSDSKTDPPGESVKPSSPLTAERPHRRDRNLDIYYRNRTEFSLDIGYHPVNIPFIYDFAVGDSYNMTPLKYTLVPIVASLRWHVTNVGWKWIFRGNMDFTFSGSITAIPRGPETHYYSFDFGIRRNFVYRNWKVVPYWDQRGGAGIINAKEPLGVLFAQGQNLTFTYNMGAGVRYNIDDKYSFSGGLNYMHISNGYLSQPAFYNYGINVYGPTFGFDMRLGKPRHHGSE